MEVNALKAFNLILEKNNKITERENEYKDLKEEYRKTIDELKKAKVEIKELQKQKAQLKKIIDTTIGIAYDQDEQEAIDFLINEKDHYPNLFDN